MFCGGLCWYCHLHRVAGFAVRLTVHVETMRVKRSLSLLGSGTELQRCLLSACVYSYTNLFGRAHFDRSCAGCHGVHKLALDWTTSSYTLQLYAEVLSEV